jgi:glycosyltransferase involved in cell wall biosynthesis
MITVNHVLSSRIHPSQIFDDLYRRYETLAPDHFTLSKTFVADSKAMIRHYHRPHREWRLIGPSVVTMHHDPLETYPFLNADLFLPKWRQASKVICLNSAQKQFLDSHHITQNTVIPHGVDRNVFPAPDKPRAIAGNKIVLGFVSKRYPRGIKGEARLFTLFDSLNPSHFSFVFVGEGRWRDAKKALEKGFEAECYENLPYHLYGSVFAKMSALLISSEFEGGPASLPEALGSGLPVLARPVGMVPDRVVNNVNGLILTDRDWIEQITSLANIEGLLNTLNQGAFESAHSYPSWEEVISRQYSVYREILGLSQ